MRNALSEASHEYMTEIGMGLAKEVVVGMRTTVDDVIVGQTRLDANEVVPASVIDAIAAGLA
jgi:hypothetical protein